MMNGSTGPNWTTNKQIALRTIECVSERPFNNRNVEALLRLGKVSFCPIAAPHRQRRDRTNRQVCPWLRRKNCSPVVRHVKRPRYTKSLLQFFLNDDGGFVAVLLRPVKLREHIGNNPIPLAFLHPQPPWWKFRSVYGATDALQP